MKNSTSGSVKFVSMISDHASNTFEADGYMSDDHLQDKCRSSHATNLTDKSKVCMIMYI